MNEVPRHLITRLNYYNYFTEIEETFVRRRARNLLLSPVDWALMDSWRERGIPLHIVVRAVEQVFDNFDKNPGPRSVKGLMFCREEVEAQYHEWQTAQVGKNDEAGENGSTGLSLEEIREHIAGLAVSLEGRQAVLPYLSEALERACVRLREIAESKGASLELIDKSLRDIETLLDEALVKHADRSLVAMIEKDTASQLKPHRASMTDDAYKTTYRLMLLKRLREELDIPRLSLFYL